ncbi:unnamed protein product (macronuclear) [Paramecium tetraurelia]|uniref:Uncharacterized protein n=1 Tax=Paramecium tetraurelia TaxID=5888 RepID=A0CUH6_PARTE|nr:uncharacterized protein GSPATT00010643001 [Paramecium tetraurelia]CAK74443.1 unnamed protein product [Paramecium tetraurelia]|eukprot:XP_001441840.1 hypothetical protein (macronuclear) [Paramecium tetraurelia strain d4-2]
MQNGIVETADHFQMASSNIYDCFAEFYGPETIINKNQIEYIKAIAHQNLKKIHSLLRKQKQETQYVLQPFKIMTKKDKMLILSDPKNADILKRDSRQSRTETITNPSGEDNLNLNIKQ